MMIIKNAYQKAVRFCNCITRKNVQLHFISGKSKLHFTTCLNGNDSDRNRQNSVTNTITENDYNYENHSMDVDKDNIPIKMDVHHSVDLEFEKSIIYQNLKDQIREIIEQEKIVLFMKGTPEKPLCGYSANVVNILGQLNLKEYIYIDVLKNANLREAIKIYSSWPFIPILYVNKEFIGGHDIIADLYCSGELTNLMK